MLLGKHCFRCGHGVSAHNAGADKKCVCGWCREGFLAGPVTMEQAKKGGLWGWNVRCNRCGSYGAEWLDGERPGRGALALCAPHKLELRAERERHAKRIAELRAVKYEQDEERLVR
ncbi:MAG TPA: hypothetical protein VK735_39840 [Pseudonocardia sp.]|uniref:hypothetical protein n=1 Tax=Pseudonocardia sp. TaxID=60912 RepID=UPI002B6C31FE|nr:hypothetical protein [Pseudonocardia sp.]HTF53636.1 hypothetical protein [Pseudonocardia sp.]